MKKLVLALVPAIAMVASMSSCTKDETTPTIPKVDTPVVNNTAPTPFTPTFGDVNGSLAAVQMKYSMEQMGFPIDISYETAVATFTNGSTTLVDAGTVSVNGINLEKQTNNSYLKMATTGLTTADLKYSSGVDWSVSGTGNIPTVSYKHGTNFPEYTGTVPTEITKANGLSFTFNTSNTMNADSVYVFVGASNGKTFIKGYAPNAGTVKITASDLSGLPTVTDKTAYLEVLPVKFDVQSFSGKPFVFIKEQAIVRNVNIN
ncbi:MAG: hypothetical protein EOP51_12225 [Sphingobacteriales bacterium]|nr:MAG: hypothetical protein EOP51_12225 [Sphingobacteriales bacterium]